MSSLSIHDPEEGPQVEIPTEAALHELRFDGFDQWHEIGSSVARKVIHRPELKDFQSVVEPMNINVVPISPARPASAFDYETPIAKAVNLEVDADNYLAAYPGLGDSELSTSLVYEMNMSRRTSDSVPVHAFCTRVIQARLAAETGATASHAPDDRGWDIKIVDEKKCGEAMNEYPQHIPILIPRYMNEKVASALLSLLVPGGAGAYTWRFRTAGDPRGAAGMMPSYCRFRHPGGGSKILAIYKRTPEQAEFGGTALTVENLTCLEEFYSHRWGRTYWNQAYKTIAAMGAVYLDPVASTDDLGHGFSCAHQTRTQGGVDLAKVRNWHATPPPGKVEISYPLEYPIDIPHEWLDPLVNSFHTMITGKSQSDIEPVKWYFEHNEVLVNMIPSDSDDDEWYDDIESFAVSHSGDPVGCYDMFSVLEWIIDPQNGHSAHEVSLASRIATQILDNTLANSYSASRDDTDPNDGEYSGYRNVFGFNDAAPLALPYFNLEGSVCMLNFVHMPKRIPVATTIPFDPRDSDRIDNAMRVYALHFHIEHILTLVRNNIWPDDLGADPICHRKIVENMADGLTCHTFMTNASRESLHASNWQLLEPIHYLRPGGKRKAYYSYDAPGSWENDQGSVPLAAKSTSYAAVDAAMRNTWMVGGTVTVDQAGTEFVAIRDANGLIAPFAAAPYAFCNSTQQTKQTGEISISHSKYLQFGANKTYDCVKEGAAEQVILPIRS